MKTQFQTWKHCGGYKTRALSHSTCKAGEPASQPPRGLGEGTIKSQAPTTYDGSTRKLATRTVAWRNARAGRVVANPL